MSHAYGRYAVAESPSSLRRLHTRTAAVLHTVDWEPKVGVLDQEDLIAQGIRVSALVPGASDVDALGSCTANATTAALSNLLPEQQFLDLVDASTYDDVVAAECWAIDFYHECSDQTGDPAQEWPPTDCGSSGPYIVSELQRLKLISGDKIAHGADNICSLLQEGCLIVGQPFLNAWETPDAQGFIDGDGSASTLRAQIAGGVAGGHETCLCAIESLVLDSQGAVVPERTVVRFRNSWGRAWGDAGDYRAHLSTYVALGAFCDFRSLVAL